MKTLFISGTDTGVGKTLASGLLCKELIAGGFKTAYMKAVQTGSEKVNGQWQSLDLDFVQAICGDQLKSFCPIQFSLPASPHLAAAEEGVTIDPQLIVKAQQQIHMEADFDYLVIEGAGGLAVPLKDDYYMSDLAKELEAQLIIVTRPGLGTLNHSKLTYDFAAAAGLAGNISVIVSGVAEDADVIEADNRKQIGKIFKGRVLCEIPQIKKLDTEILPEGDVSAQFEHINFNLNLIQK